MQKFKDVYFMCEWMLDKANIKSHGQELLCLSRELLKIKSIEQANNWQSKFKIWKDKYYEFISQKSVNPETGEIWFTHARLNQQLLI